MCSPAGSMKTDWHVKAGGRSEPWESPLWSSTLWLWGSWPSACASCWLASRRTDAVWPTCLNTRSTGWVHSLGLDPTYCENRPNISSCGTQLEKWFRFFFSSTLSRRYQWSQWDAFKATSWTETCYRYLTDRFLFTPAPVHTMSRLAQTSQVKKHR